MTEEEMKTKVELLERQLITLETVTVVALGYIASHLYQIAPELDDSLDSMMATWEDIGEDDYPHTTQGEVAERFFEAARSSMAAGSSTRH